MQKQSHRAVEENMKYLIWIFLIVLVLSCTYIGCRHKVIGVYETTPVDTEHDTNSAPKLSDEDIAEIIRMADSVKLYGFKEGIRRYHKDTIHITDEDSVMLREVYQDIMSEISAKNNILNDE